MSNQVVRICAIVQVTLLPSVAFADTEGGMPPDADEPPLSSRAPEPAPAEVGYQAESGVATSYVFRGRTQYARRTDASSQSSVAATWNHAGPGALSLTVWNATALANARAQPGTALEIDLTAAYGVTLAKRVDASAGFTSYLYPRAIAHQHVDGAYEPYLTLALPNDVVTPMIGVYPEVVRAHGAYAVVGISRKLAFRTLSVVPQASVGAAGYEGAPAHLNDVSAALVGQWAFHPNAYISARAAWSYMGGPTALLPSGDGTFAGRSVPWGMLALGVQR
jgi:hypothetical protein